jgi:hypothetical protein
MTSDTATFTRMDQSTEGDILPLGEFELVRQFFGNYPAGY